MSWLKVWEIGEGGQEVWAVLAGCSAECQLCMDKHLSPWAALSTSSKGKSSISPVGAVWPRSTLSTPCLGMQMSTGSLWAKWPFPVLDFRDWAEISDALSLVRSALSLCGQLGGHCLLFLPIFCLGFIWLQYCGETRPVSHATKSEGACGRRLESIFPTCVHL